MSEGLWGITLAFLPSYGQFYFLCLPLNAVSTSKDEQSGLSPSALSSVREMYGDC